jgi:hypothetical protein
MHMAISFFSNQKSQSPCKYPELTSHATPPHLSTVQANHARLDAAAHAVSIIQAPRAVTAHIIAIVHGR